MIHDEIRKIDDYYDIHTFTEGKCGREINRKGEWDNWHHRNRQELVNLRNAIEYELNFGHKEAKIIQGWD